MRFVLGILRGLIIGSLAIAALFAWAAATYAWFKDTWIIPRQIKRARVYGLPPPRRTCRPFLFWMASFTACLALLAIISIFWPPG